MDNGSEPPDDLRTRVRWGNVARAAALLAIAALVIAWPHLRAPAPELPAGTAAPVGQVPAAPAAPEPEPEPEPVTTRPSPLPEVREPVHDAAEPRRTKRPRAPKRRAPAARGTPSPVVPAPIRRGPPAPAPAEFGVE